MTFLIKNLFKSSLFCFILGFFLGSLITCLLVLKYGDLQNDLINIDNFEKHEKGYKYKFINSLLECELPQGSIITWAGPLRHKVENYINS